MEELDKKTEGLAKIEGTNKTPEGFGKKEALDKKTKDLIVILTLVIGLVTIFFVVAAVRATSARKQAFMLKSDLKQLKQDFQTKEEDLKTQLGEVTVARDDLDRKLVELATTNKKLEARMEEADNYIQILKDDLQNQRKDILSEINELISGNRKVERALLEKIEELSKMNKVLQHTINELSRLAKLKPREKKETEDAIALDKIVVSSDQEEEEGTSYLIGNVLNINARYNFVIFDLGEEDGIRQNLELPVYRKKKKIGEIRVKEVYTHMSLANIIEEKTASEIRKGDEVQFVP